MADIVDDSEFTVRITGLPPPTLTQKINKSTGSKSGERRGKVDKSAKSQTQQHQMRCNLRLRPSTPLEQLKKDVFALFNVTYEGISSSTSGRPRYQLIFLSGFPPKELDSDGKETVHELGIRPSESLIVKFEPVENPNDRFESKDSSMKARANTANRENRINKQDTGEGGDANKSKLTLEPLASNSGRQKRASAMAATASFKDVIASQDAMMNQQQNSSLNFKTGGKKRVVASKPILTKKIKIEGSGYRLSDGKPFPGLSPKKSSSQQPLFKSEDDVANKLLSSLGGGDDGKRGNLGKFLRAAMKGAVAKSFEASRASVRVAAVNQGNFDFEKVKGGMTCNDGGVVLGRVKDHESKPKSRSASKGSDTYPNVGSRCESESDEDEKTLGKFLYNVHYSKGIEGRGRYSEEVEIIGFDALKGVLQAVYDCESDDDPDENATNGNKDGKEMLRPVSIAQMSPRAFWSLVYHYRKNRKRHLEQKSNDKASVEDMLQSIMPHLDWSHLERGGRNRVLSEKAKENLRQEQEAKKSTFSDTSHTKNEDGVKVIEEVETFVMDSILTDGDSTDTVTEIAERERRAQAALARFGNIEWIKSSSLPLTPRHSNTNHDGWALITPIEDDIDELIECIMEGAADDDEDSAKERYDNDAARTWAQSLVQCGPNSTPIRNWRELANSDVKDILSIIKKNNANLKNESFIAPSLSTIELWIEAAQQRSLDEIMLEILDGDEDALKLLSEKARSGTPKDLSYWYSASKYLMTAISCAAQTGDNSVEYTCQERTEGDVRRWILRAKIAIASFPWLDLYTTTVS